MPHERDTSNVFFQLAESFVNFTDRNLFLTGRAGTGKTTFLKHIKETTSKLTVVTAPTGVAAINAGGVTLHSFFQLPFVPFISDGKYQDNGRWASPASLFQKIRFNENKRKLLRELELLIIDEVSMVRADMLDAVDAILRRFRGRHREPFGGVQVLMIGDPYQLPPVVVQEDEAILREYYKSSFFFDANVMKESPPVCIELQKIYRQKDEEFINLLNRVRDDRVLEEDLTFLNSRFEKDFRPPKSERYITLCSHNYIADEINDRELKKLPGKTYEFEAEIEGDFNEKAYPAEVKMKLKKGAQIMFIKNDKGEVRRYYNGKLGTIQDIDDDKIVISFPDENTELELELEEWQNIRYTFNEEKKKAEEEVLGRFKQYPIRLAWAITIHKSQGLTFDRAVIDAGASFTAGQVYVALSRLTSLEGLVLRSRIPRFSISCDENVEAFMDRRQDEKVLSEWLAKDQQQFIRKTLISSFDFSKIVDVINNILKTYREKKSPMSAVAVKEGTEWLQKTADLQKVADQFSQKELSRILTEDPVDYGRLYQRMNDAVTYFNPRVKDELFDTIEKQMTSTKKQSKTKKYLKALYSLQLLVLEKKKGFQQALRLAEGLRDGKNGIDLLNQIGKEGKAVDYAPPAEMTQKRKPQKGESQRMSFEMFKEGKSVEDIALERGLTPNTIEGHLAQFVTDGKLSVFEVVNEEKVNTILPLVAQAEELKATPIKDLLGDEYSYGEIRLVMNHWLYLQKQES